MTSVGDYLRKEREARHLSVQEVAELTKISERYLACIECGEYDQLPPGPYAKGYIAAYARQVCGDETQALKLYSGYRAADQGSGINPVQVGEAILGDGAAFPPSNDKGGGKWQAKVATGLSFARSLRQSLYEKGNLKHLSTGGAKEKPTLATRLRALLGPLVKLTAVITRFPKGILLKGGLVAGLVLVCAVVLVLAGFGAYHIYIFQEPSEAPSAPQARVAVPPPTPDVNAGEKLTTAAPTAESGANTVKPQTAVKKTTPASTPKLSAKAPPQKSEKVIIASPPATEKAVKRPPEPLKDETRTATAAAPQPSASEASPPQTDPEAAVARIPVELIKASVCTAIEERMPVGVSEVFPWTTNKIYVWSLLRANDPPAKVRHIYYHADRMVSDVTLTVGSSHWRTWSFHTLSGQLHIGPWHIDIATMDGRVMRRLHFEIQ
jgi:hypothetical protein